jgi:hypothetical protein
MGLRFKEANPSPRFDRHGGIVKDSPALRIHNWYDAVAFLRMAFLRTAFEGAVNPDGGSIGSFG